MSTTGSKWFKFVSLLFIALMVVGTAAFAFPVQAVSAQAGEPPSTDSQNQDGANRRIIFLERAYQALLRFSEHVGKDYERIPNIVERIESLIGKLEENGLDPTPIPAALAEFQTAAVTDQSEYTEALAILAAHSGFDDDGKVIDRGQAAQTINQARVALQKAHRGFHEALQELRDVLQQYREDHPLPDQNSPDA